MVPIRRVGLCKQPLHCVCACVCVGEPAKMRLALGQTSFWHALSAPSSLPKSFVCAAH